jgi:hypothetical protein
VTSPRTSRVTDDSQVTNDMADSVGAESPTASENAQHSGSSTPHRKAIPALVRREVLTRDGGRCQAKLHDGTVCGSRIRLQFDHVQPVALGGPSTTANVRVLCERHNQLAARRIFGDGWMDRCSGG